MTDQPLTAGTPLTVRSGRVKEARKLSRRSVRAERRLFLAEGRNAVTEALAAGVVEEVFARPDRHYLLPEIPADVTRTWVDDRAMAALSDSVTPAGVVALCRFIDLPHDQALVGPFVAICAHVSDPGNAGTVIRCADAAGAGGVLLTGESVDLYNPKTIRATAGSAFHLPIAQEAHPYDVIGAAQAAGFAVIAADGSGETDLFEAGDVLRQPVAWLFGNEAHGMSPDLLERADHRVRIPIHGRAESLNLSTAAALCLYESARAGSS